MLNDLNGDAQSVFAQKEKVQAFCEERDWDQFHGAKDLAIGIITEASELLEHFRFKSPEEVETLFKDSQKKDAICQELADVWFFVLRFSQKYEIDLVKCLDEKLRKNAEKYPVAQSKGSNKKYTELGS